MNTTLPRAGFEVELLAPVGVSRFDLAREIASRAGGSVRRRFHVDTEASSAPGVKTFWHLTPAFDVVDVGGGSVCSLVDDTTIVADLDARAPSKPGWYRILSDEPRLLRLVERHVDPAAGIGSVLAPVAELFGARIADVGGVRKLDDSVGATIVMAAPLPGERERPCEIVTPPWEGDHVRLLEELLGPARDLGFTVPAEAAVHVNLDAAPFRDVERFRHVVSTFGERREELRELFSTNPRCTRLAPLPAELVDLVRQDWPDWASLRAAAAGTPVTKFSDVNLTRVLGVRPGPEVLEVRILPGSIDGSAIVGQFAQLAELLRSTR